jgi:hypothetical protein
MNKNKSFHCNENEQADQLLCMLENNAVLSESFTRKITNIVLVILTNLDGNQDWVESEITKLREELDWLMIFSEDFKGKLIGQLLLTLERQITLNKKEKSEV